MTDDKWDLDDDAINFLPDEIIEETKVEGFYKILISDDEEEVHNITKILLKNFRFEGKGVEFFDAYSGAETIEILSKNDDIAIIFLDVVMEENYSGLKVVKYIRDTLKNSTVRIILRTGQPGEAPEEEIIRKYDINDYRLKTELTAKRLLTSLYTAMRSYRDLIRLKQYQEGLEKIIKASSNMFKNNSMDEFLTCILDELSSFTSDKNDAIYLRTTQPSPSNGFITVSDSSNSIIIAATGQFEQYIGKKISTITELSEIHNHLELINNGEPAKKVIKVSNGFLICNYSNRTANNYVFIQGKVESFDFDMINLFLSNFSIALDNFMLNNQLNDTQKEFVYALADTAETHFEETGSHIKRISNMMYNFALVNNFSYHEAERLKLSSTMHDLGKVSIPDKVLKKPGKFTEEEFNLMKNHSQMGYNILSGSDVAILRSAAEIALNHHEKFNGEGYPNKLVGRNIPLNARMMAIVDVYDAMTHKRCYKDAFSQEDTLKYIEGNSGTHFDPALVSIFFANLEAILQEPPQ